MSSPGINRWGHNLFWYHHWYADKQKQLVIQQDYIFNKLIYSYLFYGIFFPKNIFISKYWYNSILKIKWDMHRLFDEKHYRMVEMRNEFSLEKFKQKHRVRAPQLYYSKIWILRFQHWLIINFYSLKPFKKVKNPYNKDIFNTSLISVKNYKKKTILKKVNLLFNYIFLNLKKKNKINYIF